MSPDISAPKYNEKMLRAAISASTAESTSLRALPPRTRFASVAMKEKVSAFTSLALRPFDPGKDLMNSADSAGV